jgi:riboflavin biosynthesis pyrimidine reductase
MDSTKDDLGRPRVVVSSVMSADGRLTLSSDQLLMHEETNRVWQALQPPSAQAVEDARSALLDRLYQPQVVLEGSGTFVTDETGPLSGLPAVDPAEDLHADYLPDGIVQDPDNGKWFAVVDGRGRLRWTMTSNGGYRLLILVAEATPAAYLAYLRAERIPYLVVGGKRVDLATALRRMADKLGVTCVVSKAGGGLNGALLRDGLVEEVQIVVFPALIGGKGTPALFDGPQLSGGQLPTPLRLRSVHTETDGLLWLRYEVLRTAEAPASG